VVELEREKFKAQEATAAKEAEVAKLREEVEAAADAKRFLEDELNALRDSHQDGLEATMRERYARPPMARCLCPVLG
jgi:hypothetical protein